MERVSLADVDDRRGPADGKRTFGTTDVAVNYFCLECGNETGRWTD